MKFHYLIDKKRLNVFGTDSVKDITEIKRLIVKKKIPSDLKSIVYQKAKNSTVCLIIRGRYLENILRAEEEAAVIVPIASAPRAGIKDILKQINEANTRQGSFAGLLLYCTDSKRFLLFTPRGQSAQLLGDHPAIDEPPSHTVCRVAKEDADFEIEPHHLIPLIPLEINDTTYYSFLGLSEREFAPKTSPRIASWQWKSFEAMEELQLDRAVSALFEKDKKLQRLTKPIEIDFAKLIDEILHSK